MCKSAFFRALILGVTLSLFLVGSIVAQYTPRTKTPSTKASSITITEPSAGAVWEKGQRYTIKWTSSNVRGGLKINLINAKGKSYTVTGYATNSGSYNYTMSSSLPDGVYTLEIKTSDGSVTAKSPGTLTVQARTLLPKPEATPTYAPRVPPTATTEPESTTPTTSTTQPVNVAEHSTVASPDVVRHDFAATQVPISEVQIIDVPTIIPTTTIQPRTPDMKILPSMIDVTAPVADVAWQAGEQYTIRWASSDLDGPVKIDLIKAQRGTDGVVSYLTSPVVASTENDGAYEYLVPERMGYHSNYFVCEVSSLDGQTKDQSPAYFDVYTEPIDMTCQVVDLSQKEEKDRYFVYYRTERWLEFDVWLRNNGTHRQIDNVMVSVMLIKEPEELVVAQEEWGLSSINAQLWYSTPEPRKFDIYKYEATVVSSDRDVNCESGAYRIEIEVDPENRLGENPALRDNNKYVCRFNIR